MAYSIRRHATYQVCQHLCHKLGGLGSANEHRGLAHLHNLGLAFLKYTLALTGLGGLCNGNCHRSHDAVAWCAGTIEFVDT